MGYPEKSKCCSRVLSALLPDRVELYFLYVLAEQGKPPTDRTGTSASDRLTVSSRWKDMMSMN